MRGPKGAGMLNHPLGRCLHNYLIVNSCSLSSGIESLDFVKFKSFLFGQLKSSDAYGLVVTRLVIAAFWINAIIPRWVALRTSPIAHPLVITLFGSNMAVVLTYIFTILETLGAVSFILGLGVRLTSVWGVAEFIITGTYGVGVGNISLSKDLGLLAGSFRLLLSGCPRISFDGYLLSRKTASAK